MLHISRPAERVVLRDAAPGLKSRPTTQSRPATRFAPAPTGHLHAGHVLNAIYVWGVARAIGARVLLRIEDHDLQRSRREYEASILADLEWLGFEADEMTRQSERGHVYEDALSRLRAAGLTYACECSRSPIGGGRYPGTCRDRGLEETAGRGIRVRMEPGVERFDDLLLGPQAQSPDEQIGDVLLRDRHGLWTYQMSATADDFVQDVTHVIRGDDLLDSTGRQIRLARLLGRAQAPVFLHHPLIMKSAVQKVSKSDADTGIRELRADGWSPARVLGFTAALAGLLPDERPISVGDLAEIVAAPDR